jgi:hypothetical protein
MEGREEGREGGRVKRGERKRKEKGKSIGRELGGLGIRLTTRTHSRPTTKREIFPAHPQPPLLLRIEPALRPEDVRILAIQISTSMHGANVKDDELAFSDQNWAPALLAAAEGQNRVLERLAAILGRDGVQALAFGQDGAEVLEVLQLLVAGLLAVERVDLVAEASPDVGALGELEPDVCQEGGGGVGGGEEDAQGLGADADFVAGLGDEFFHKDIAGISVGCGGFHWLLGG